MVIMKKLYIVLILAAALFCSCEKKGVWGDPGEISDIRSEGLEYGVKIIFTAPVDHDDYYYTLISYKDADGVQKHLRVSRYDADANGVTEADVTDLSEIQEYSFTAKPYSFGGAGGNSLTVEGTPITPDQVGYITFNLNTASTQTYVKKVDDFEYHIETTGIDANVQTNSLTAPIKGKKMTYYYKANAIGNGLQIFFICSGQPVATWAKQTTPYLPAAVADASEWTYLELDLSEYIDKYGWGKAGDAMRLDFGNASGATMDIKKILFKK